MSFAVSADWQFDSYARLSTPHPSGLTSRLVDFLDCWRWVDAEATKRGAGWHVIAGDVFNNRSTIDLPVLDAVCRAVREKSKVKKTFIPGNHDSHLRTTAINSIQSLFGVAQVIDKPTLHVAEGGVAVGLVPWSDDLTAFRQGVDAVSLEGAEILISHVLVEGTVPKGGIPVEYLSPKKFKRVFLGDVHDPVTHPHHANVQYVGSPLQIDFRDAGRKRGFVVYDPAKDKVTYVPNTTSPRFHVVTLAGDASNVDKGDFARVTNADPEASDKAVAAIKAKSAWVESTTAQIAEPVKPRLDVKAKDSHAEVCDRYVRYIMPELADDDSAVAALVAEGMSIIEEAKA